MQRLTPADLKIPIPNCQIICRNIEREVQLLYMASVRCVKTILYSLSIEAFFKLPLVSLAVGLKTAVLSLNFVQATSIFIKALKLDLCCLQGMEAFLKAFFNTIVIFYLLSARSGSKF